MEVDRSRKWGSAALNTTQNVYHKLKPTLEIIKQKHKYRDFKIQLRKKSLSTTEAIHTQKVWFFPVRNKSEQNYNLQTSPAQNFISETDSLCKNNIFNNFTTQNRGKKQKG